MLAQFFMKLDPVKLATTREEIDAIYRFRYTVYVNELKREIGGVDHKKKTVSDAEDEKPTSHHIYIGDVNNIVGTARLRQWDEGQIPEYEFNELSMGLFDNIQQLKTAEIGRLMISQRSRGKFILPSLACGAYEFLAKEKKVDLAFLYCRPGLINLYSRLGARPYGGDLVKAPEGLEVPLVQIASDIDFYKKMSSPLLSLAKKNFGTGPGKRAPLDVTRYSHLFDTSDHPVVDSQEVWEYLQAHILINPKIKASFLEGLPEKALKKLAQFGCIIDIPAGLLVTRENHSEREIYVILKGEYEVVQGEKVIGHLRDGDVFGEVGFFRESGQRTASVRASSDGQVIIIRRKFLDSLEKEDPRCALAIMHNLAKVMSERLANKVSNLQQPVAST